MCVRVCARVCVCTLLVREVAVISEALPIPATSQLFILNTVHFIVLACGVMYKSKKTKVARILTELCLVRIFKLRLICLAVAAKPGKLTCGDAESGRKKEREKRERACISHSTLRTTEVHTKHLLCSSAI